MVSGALTVPFYACLWAAWVWVWWCVGQPGYESCCVSDSLGMSHVMLGSLGMSHVVCRTAWVWVMWCVGQPGYESCDLRCRARCTTYLGVTMWKCMWTPDTGLHVSPDSHTCTRRGEVRNRSTCTLCTVRWSAHCQPHVCTGSASRVMPGSWPYGQWIASFPALFGRQIPGSWEAWERG